jgi:hypothetical protein
MNSSPKLVILLPITKETLSKKYINGLKMLGDSPVEKRFIVINKTSDEVIKSLEKCLTNTKQSRIDIINKHGTGIFEGFSGIELQDNEWIMQVHDDDWGVGHVREFNPISRFTVLQPTWIGRFRFVVSSKRRNAWIFSATPKIFWDALLSYFQFVDKKPFPSSDQTLNCLIDLIGNKEKLKGYRYHYSNKNWRRSSSGNHLEKILTESDWGFYNTPKIAMLNLKIDTLAFLVFTVGKETFREFDTFIKTEIVNCIDDLCNYVKLYESLTHKGKGFGRVIKKAGPTEYETLYFNAFLGVKSLLEITQGIDRLGSIDNLSLAGRAQKWSLILRELL